MFCHRCCFCCGIRHVFSPAQIEGAIYPRRPSGIAVLCSALLCSQVYLLPSTPLYIPRTCHGFYRAEASVPPLLVDFRLFFTRSSAQGTAKAWWLLGYTRAYPQFDASRRGEKTLKLSRDKSQGTSDANSGEGGVSPAMSYEKEEVGQVGQKTIDGMEVTQEKGRGCTQVRNVLG